MLIHRIVLDNVGPYRGHHEIALALPQDGRPGITVIGGLNGAGKTTLLQAVLLALYGEWSPWFRQERGSYSAYLEHLATRSTESEPHAVELHLVLPDEHVRVRRSWQVAQVRWVDRLDVWRNDVPDPELAQAWPSYVEELLPVDLASLFFFDGETIGNLAELDETPAAVQRAVRALLGLGIVDRAMRDLRRISGRIRRANGSGADTERLTQLDAERQTLELERQQAAQALAQITGRLEQVAARVKAAERAYLAAQGVFAADRDALQAERDRLVAERAQLLAELVHAAAGPLPLLLVGEALDRLHAMGRRAEAVSRAQQALPVVQDLEQKLMGALGHRKLPIAVTDTVRQVLRQEVADLQRIAETATPVTLSAVALSQITDLLQRRTALIDQVREALHRVRQCDARLSQIEDHWRRGGDDAAADAARVEWQDLVREEASLRAQQRAAEGRLADVAARLARNEQAQSALLESHRLETEALRVTAYAQRAEETLRQFRTAFAARRLAQLETSVTDALHTLLRKADLVARITIDPETWRFRVLDGHNAEIPKSSLSSGERQMLALAILWGLANSMAYTLPVIIDTPMARLDSVHRRRFVTRYVPHAAAQVALLSTDTEIAGPLWSALAPHVGTTYTLVYDDAAGSTRVVPGYFPTEAEVAAR